MVSFSFRRLACVSLMLLVASPLAAAELNVYRNFTLGASTREVLAHVRQVDRDLATQHVRPALIQEISWRPGYTGAQPRDASESVRVMAFSFINDALFRIVVEYDARKTEGLTKADMIGSMSLLYGDRVPAGTRPVLTADDDGLEASAVVAQWRRGDHVVTLRQATYRGTDTLVVVSTPVARQAFQARAAALVLDTQEAPAREAARIRKDADLAAKASEQQRTSNKATFQP